MRKIGLVTITDNGNYGNRLQNYATKKIFEKYKCDVVTLWDKREFNSLREIKTIIKSFNPKYKINLKRYNKFKKFTKKYINNYYINYSKISSNDFDAFLIGSDQILNDGLTFKLDFLLNINKTIMMLSPSFGTNKIKEEKKSFYEQLFSKIKNISVREYRGKCIIEDITHRKDIEVLVDPTMMIDRDDWKKIEKRPPILKYEKYILCYFLGNLSEKRRQVINKTAIDNNCEIINILDPKSPFYECDPGEFLYLEKNAFLICTDSFHSSVFALMYNRPFVIFNREDNKANMNSRLETLVEKFKLKNRNYNEISITKENLNTDYAEAYQILEEERKRADEYIRKSLEQV